MNVNDSEIISGQLEEMGLQETSDINQASIIILNTCCVRKKVEDKIYSMAGRVSLIKKENPEIIFGICGCLAQKETIEIKSKVPSVDIIFGPSQVPFFKIILNSYLLDNEKNTIVNCNNKAPFCMKNRAIKNYNSISAFVQIMKGCNNFCSYCIVPFTRGPEESKPAEDILTEVKELASKYFKEIFLLGQNVNSYGNDLNNQDNFLSLLSKINDIPGIERIRFTTSHPKDFNLNLIKIIKNGSKICEHIHLPIQSGSNKILKRMNRQYDMNQYNYIINQIRKYMPDASITTDVMVGFPGETEKDFEDTIQAFKNIQFDSAYTFIYSNREKTLSSFFDKQIDLSIKKKRLWELIELQKNISLEKNRKIIGKTVEVLVESNSRKNIKNQYWGKTRTNKVVVFNDNYQDDNHIFFGDLVKVKIHQADSYTLFGEFNSKCQY